MTALSPRTPFGANFPSIGVNNSGTCCQRPHFSNFNLTGAESDFAQLEHRGQPAKQRYNIPHLARERTPRAPTATPCQTGATDPNFTKLNPFSGMWTSNG